jgi:hypothetical protein
VVQRALGKAQASAATFQKAMQSPGRGAQVTRLLTLAVAGVVPDRTRWAREWPKVRLASPSGASDPHPSIAWPGVASHRLRDAIPSRSRHVDLEDVSLPLYSLLTAGAVCRRDTSSLHGAPAENWPDSYVADHGVVEFRDHAGPADDGKSTTP